jgi:hypothetical protein
VALLCETAAFSTTKSDFSLCSVANRYLQFYRKRLRFLIEINKYSYWAFEHYPSSFCIWNNVSETGFCLRLQVKPQLGPIDRASSLSPDTSKVKVRVTLRLALYRQSLHLASSTLRPTTRDFFPNNPFCNSPYVTSSLTWRWACLLYAWPFVKCTYRTYSMLLKILPCALYASPVSIGFADQMMPILHILCYNGSLVTWTVVSLTTAKFKPHTLDTSSNTRHDI